MEDCAENKKLPVKVLMKIGSTFHDKKTHKMKCTLEAFRSNRNQMSDFISSKQEMRLPAIKGESVEETKHAFHKENCKFDQIKQKLRKARKAFNETRKNFELEWTDLCNKEIALQESFIKFNSFIRLNFVKRERAEAKINEQMMLITERTANAGKMSAIISEMKQYKEQLDINMETHKIYEDYLKEVINGYPLYNTYDQIMYRYEELKTSKNTLAAKQNKFLDILQSMQVKMENSYRENYLTLLGLTTLLTKLHHRFSHAQGRSVFWEEQLSEVKKQIICRSQDNEGTKAAIWDLYNKMCIRKRMVPSLQKGEVSEQCCFIRKTLQDIMRVLDKVYMHASASKSFTSRTILSKSMVYS